MRDPDKEPVFIQPLSDLVDAVEELLAIVDAGYLLHNSGVVQKLRHAVSIVKEFT